MPMSRAATSRVNAPQGPREARRGTAQRSATGRLQEGGDLRMRLAAAPTANLDVLLCPLQQPPRLRQFFLSPIHLLPDVLAFQILVRELRPPREGLVFDLT